MRPIFSISHNISTIVCGSGSYRRCVQIWCMRALARPARSYYLGEASTFNGHLQQTPASIHTLSRIANLVSETFVRVKSQRDLSFTSRPVTIRHQVPRYGRNLPFWTAHCPTNTGSTRKNSCQCKKLSTNRSDPIVTSDCRKRQCLQFEFGQ